MPFSFRIPRFFRRSPKTSPTGPHDDAATSLLPGARPSSSRPSSRLGVPWMDVNSATASRSLASGHPVDPRNPTGHIQKDGALDESSGQPSQALDALTHTDVVGSKSTKTHSPHSSVAPQPAHLPCPPAPTDSQQTLVLAPQHSPYSLTTPSQHCLNSSQLTQPQGQHSSQPQPHLTGLFNQAHDFTVMGTFIEGNVTYNNTTSNQCK
ncbi:hypothetical protein Agabi119p4_8387 [Agaricus bisporus var. burnettii]|uniref:Uncharacterized protein n=1 Tax=Agaricus bisporus var. burnettii TaxID=192524 RepID=A0A8H7C655_AGABI|nr:hypothetical protein Agabi119p4_8387 [Agaricus bisporus var. burnettii]